MSSFEIAKETMMLLITMMVLVFVSVFFYVVLGNYKVGSEVDVSEREAELVSMRIIRCLGGSINLNECVKQDKYGAKVLYNNKVLFVNKELYEKLFSEFESLYIWHPPKTFKQFLTDERDIDFYANFWYKDPFKRFVDNDINKDFSNTEVHLLFKIKKDE